MTSVSLQTRSLFYSIVHEVCSGEGEYHDLDPAVWEKACKVVGDALWTYKPSDYFAVVFHNLQNSEVQGIDTTSDMGSSHSSGSYGFDYGYSRRSNKNDRSKPVFMDTSSVSYPLQAAVMAGLLPQPLPPSRSLLL